MLDFMTRVADGLERWRDRRRLAHRRAKAARPDYGQASDRFDWYEISDGMLSNALLLVRAGRSIVLLLLVIYVLAIAWLFW